MSFKDFNEYGLGNTSIYRAKKYCPSGNLYLKREMENPTGSIKARTAYYILKNLIKTNRLKPGVKLVESSSGNLGLAIDYFAREAGVEFMCLVDPSIPQDKLYELNNAGVNTYIVSLEDNPDYRSARIRMAQRLDQQSDWIWTNQYDNVANVKAHYETTGPEIWSQMNGRLDYFVCSVGTGGTICGIGHYLKQQDPNIKIVAVEPEGSTTFGGMPGNYLSVGAGMRGASGIFKKYGYIVDYYCKISDRDALQECVGVTTGMVLTVSLYLANLHPDKKIVTIAPDSGDKYDSYFESFLPYSYNGLKVSLSKYDHIYTKAKKVLP